MREADRYDLLVWQGGEVSDFMLKFESKGTGNVNGGIQVPQLPDRG